MELEIENGLEEKTLSACSKIANIESGLYENAQDCLRNYLQENYSNCKVCFICESRNYIFCNNLLNELPIESAFVFSDNVQNQKHLDNVKNVINNSSLVVCIENESVNFAKYICKLLKEDCLFYFNKMPEIDAFLPICCNFNEKSFEYESCEPIKNYIISYYPPEKFDRESLVNSFFSCLGYFTLFLENLINSYLFNVRLSKLFKEYFIDYSNRMNEFLNQIYFMPEDFLDNYLVFVQEFADFLIEYDINFNTKENIFAKLYFKLNNKNKLTFSEIRLIGAQSFVKIYFEFFNNLPNLNFSLFDLQKKLDLLELHFKDINFEIEDYSKMNVEKIGYLVSKHRSKLQKKIGTFVQVLDLMINNALDLYADSGYLLSKRLDENMAIRAFYFTPDFLNDKSLIKIIRDFGILEYS